MKVLKQSFSVKYHYNIYFTKGLFDKHNPIFTKTLEKNTNAPAKFIVVIDKRITETKPELYKQIIEYAHFHNNEIQLCGQPLCLPGGEEIKNDGTLIEAIYKQVNDNGIDRHSYIVAIGGGALLDAVGYAAATAHRGIRLIRVPTTVLAQGDSGVGVKNGVDYFGKKNYIGTFAPPFAVLVDSKFLTSLEFRDWLSGLAEAVKVALIKDANLFNYITAHTEKILHHKDERAMQHIIHRSAELHMIHIGTQGDPFELGSSRPLDFGHWSAHKLEQSTHYRLRHGEAVAIGVALDSTYSYLTGLLPKKDWEQIIDTLTNLGFQLYVPELSEGIYDPEHPNSIFKGLVEFREHLGGELTIMLLKRIGKGIEVHSVDFDVYRKAIDIIKEISYAKAIS